MGTPAHTDWSDESWRASHYGHVYSALRASLEAAGRNVVPGTHGIIGRALAHMRLCAARDAANRLEAISVTIIRLQQALWSGSDRNYALRRNELDKMTQQWLAAAPMFPNPETEC